jgi:hypothetical protein
LGQLQEECDFRERILQIYGTCQSEEEVEQGFVLLGDELARARTNYQKTKALDKALFGQEFEV